MFKLIALVIVLVLGVAYAEDFMKGQHARAVTTQLGDEA